MPEAGRRRRAPPSQIQITFTPRAKDQFSKERGRKETAAAARERRREAVARGGQWRETGSGETMRERSKKAAICKPRKRLSKETKAANTLILDFWPLEP